MSRDAPGCRGGSPCPSLKPSPAQLWMVNGKQCPPPAKSSFPVGRDWCGRLVRLAAHGSAASRAETGDSVDVRASRPPTALRQKHLTPAASADAALAAQSTA